MTTILESGITKCALERCGTTINQAFGYTKARHPETGEELFFCLSCYPVQAEQWTYQFPLDKKISST